MSADNRQSREIDGKGRTIRELLANRKYSVDYYQREYKWQKKQLTELVDDLAVKFLESYDLSHERSPVVAVATTSSPRGGVFADDAICWPPVSSRW